MNKYIKGLSHFGVFNKTTKFYVGSKNYKVRPNDPVVQFILAQSGVVGEDYKVLNPSSILVKAHYGSLSRVDQLNKLDLDALKIRRVFKTGVVKVNKVPNSFIRKTVVNLFRLLLQKGSRHVVEFQGRSRTLLEQFRKIAVEELDAHPELYAGRIDIGPFGTTQLYVKEVAAGKNNVLITWVEGDLWP